MRFVRTVLLLIASIICLLGSGCRYVAIKGASPCLEHKDCWVVHVKVMVEEDEENGEDSKHNSGNEVDTRR